MSDQVRTNRRRHYEVKVMDLAHELGTTSDEILALARSRNVWVKSPSTKIRKDDADTVRAFWRLRKGVRDHWAEERRNETTMFLAGGVPVDDDPELAAIRAELGVRAPRVPRRRQPRPPVPAEPLTGTAAAAAATWRGIAAEHAREIAAEWTGRFWFTDVEAAAWWGAGLGSDDAELASVLRELGITPDHLGMTIRGETVRYRLLDGNVPPEHVVRLLRNEGYL